MNRIVMPMGPFELLDHVGLDVAFKVSIILGEAFADRVRPPRILELAAGANRLGRKNARGFYRWRAGPRGRPDPTGYALVNGRGGPRAPAGAAVDRIVLAQ